MGTSRVWRRAGGNGDDDQADDRAEAHGNNGERHRGEDERDANAEFVPKRVAPRDPLVLSLQKLEEVGLVTDLQEPREHHGRIVRVTSQLAVGVDQRIRLCWEVPPEYYRDGYRLMAFRRTDGFTPEDKPKSLAAHGTKILEARADGTKDEILSEGEYFYTFVLHKSYLGLVSVDKDLVRFSERLPGAKYAIERLQDTYDARRLIGKLLKQSESIRKLGGDQRAKAGQGLSSEENLGLMAEEQAEIDAVKAAPGWKNRTKNQRDFIIGGIREKYRRIREAASER